MLTSGKNKNISTSKLHAGAKDGKFLLFLLKLGVLASSDTPAGNFYQRLASEDPVKKQSSLSCLQLLAGRRFTYGNAADLVLG